MVHTPGFAWASKPTLEIKAMEGGHCIGVFLINTCVCAGGKRTTGHRPFLWRHACWCVKAVLGGCLANARVKRTSLSSCACKDAVLAVNLTPAPLRFYHSRLVHICALFLSCVGLISAALLCHCVWLRPTAVPSWHLILLWLTHTHTFYCTSVCCEYAVLSVPEIRVTPPCTLQPPCHTRVAPQQSPC